MQYVFDNNINKPPENILEIQGLFNDISNKDIKKNNKGIYYYNLPCAFDIETSSFYRETQSGTTFDYYQTLTMKKDKKEKLEKLSIMYVWQLGINGVCFVGRTWNEFLNTLKLIKQHFKLSDNKRLIIYVHNLSFEFQFIRKLFEWQTVFALDNRKPLYCVTRETLSGFEFRCSYLLSGYSLETVANNLIKYKCKKLIGNLDYHLIRHSQTELTQKELDYCINDIKIIMLYILEYIENVKNILHIPYTKTGAVRKYCRKHCFFITPENGKQRRNFKYFDLMQNLRFNDLDEFKTVYRAFLGGFTHANANYVDDTLQNVSSFDFTSSYPYVMVSEKYPMARGIKVNPKTHKEFNKYIEKYLCVFDIEFENIFSRETFENYISVSKCFVKENFAENNGRLICAKRIVSTITNVDYKIIIKNYKFSKMRIGNMYIYEKKYLPSEFVKCILQLYETKTRLKGVDGKENEYLNSKEMLNSCYGMCVTNPLRCEILYNNETWQEKELTDLEQNEKLLKDNDNKTRFLFYLWGVFVTAYARRNLWTGIFELKNDYVYSDTDSVKCLNAEKHKLYFDVYNKTVEIKLKNACLFHGINFDLCRPKTIKGKIKMLGVWDFEGIYKRFKTLGAKRYLVEKENALTVKGVNYDFSLTVSGVNKFSAIPYLLERYGKDGIFKAFTNLLVIPQFATGKNIISYVDYETKGKVTDYNGKEYEFNEMSAAHFEPSEYSLNLTVNFLKYVFGLKNFN